MPKKERNSIGPGLIVAAAFIGPGTVTTCTLAGADFGFTLLWTIVFAVFATYHLQEMSGRVGLAAGMGLGEVIHKALPDGILRIASMILVVCAIGIGNAAYQTGNIVGASLGLSSLTSISISYWPMIIGAIAFVLLYFGSYKSLEKIFAGFVAIMSLCFILTAFLVKPDLTALIKGIFVPTLNSENMYIALGLVGTTIVPYNLFLYSSIVKEKWKGASDLQTARKDLLLAVIVGGLISMAIIITSSAAFFGKPVSISNAGEMALQLEPLLGVWAKASVAIGLFGAGMTSSMTAPLAAAYAITLTFGWKNDLKDTSFRVVWMIVLITGIFVGSMGLKPVPVIIFAQVSNGILLPLIVVLLVYVMNKKSLLGEYVNGMKENAISILIILITLTLGLRGIFRAIIQITS